MARGSPDFAVAKVLGQVLPQSMALPKAQIIGKGLSLMQLARKIDRDRRDRSLAVRVRHLQMDKTKNGLPVALAVAGTTSELYKCWITGLDATKPLLNQRYVHVQCSCEDYIFVWEYANASRNAARIFFCNGEPPDIKNPRHRAGVCKHLYCLIRRLTGV